jgi:small subunit ribosomal protein S7
MCAPHTEVKSRRALAAPPTRCPWSARPDRQSALAIRWVISYSRSRGEKGMVDRLSGELLDAFNNRGGAVKKKEETHKMAEANKAFAHYRW